MYDHVYLLMEDRADSGDTLLGVFATPIDAMDATPGHWQRHGAVWYARDEDRVVWVEQREVQLKRSHLQAPHLLAARVA